MPTQGSEPGSQALQEDSSPSEPPGKVLPKGDHIVCVCVLPKGDHIVCVYVCSGFTVYFGDCFMLVHKYLCNLVLRESFPRQVDKEPRGPQGERGLEFSRRKKGETFFPSTFFRII